MWQLEMVFVNQVQVLCFVVSWFEINFTALDKSCFLFSWLEMFRVIMF